MYVYMHYMDTCTLVEVLPWNIMQVPCYILSQGYKARAKPD